MHVKLYGIRDGLKQSDGLASLLFILVMELCDEESYS